MRTVADMQALNQLRDRLAAVAPTASRRWGTMDAQQMLSHLGDGAEAVLGVRPFTASHRPPSRAMKFMALWLPLRWPHGVKAGADPAAKVLDPEAFEADRTRAIETLVRLANAEPDALVPSHPLFGRMRQRDWHRWAFLHSDHHLRQFGA
jgi:hypothetical protein